MTSNGFECGHSVVEVIKGKVRLSHKLVFLELYKYAPCIKGNFNYRYKVCQNNCVNLIVLVVFSGLREKLATT